jgi:hypothetical protein
MTPLVSSMFRTSCIAQNDSDFFCSGYFDQNHSFTKAASHNFNLTQAFDYFSA